jgi:hypothetical protein
MGSRGTGCVFYRDIRTWSSLIIRVLLDRHPPRPRRGENRNALHQHILFVVFCKYEHLGVRVPLFFITLGMPNSATWHVS